MKLEWFWFWWTGDSGETCDSTETGDSGETCDSKETGNSEKICGTGDDSDESGKYAYSGEFSDSVEFTDFW